MSEEIIDEESSNSKAEEAKDPKAKFREALDRKKQGQGIRKNNVSGGPKISGGQASGNTQKMFRRKSGSA
jgi:hypothetical protein